MSKLVPRELEIVVVGLQHRITPSTRRMLADACESDTISTVIEREPDNIADEHAIKVVISGKPYKGLHIGYIPRATAAIMAPAIDQDDIDISSARGEITEVDPQNGTATMLLQFKAAVKTKRGKKEAAKRKPS